MSFLITSCFALSIQVIEGLSNDQLALFNTTTACYSDSVSTAGNTVCATLTITTAGDQHTFVTKDVPRHGYLTGIVYRDSFRDFCLDIYEWDTTVSFPVNPVKKATPTCAPRVLGIALDGVVIHNPYNAEELKTILPAASASSWKGVDAGRGFIGEPFDGCSGHSAPAGGFHYHALPAFGLTNDGVCFTKDMKGLFGVAVDGFPIWGPQKDDGSGEWTPADLDECNGYEKPGMGYGYVMTKEFPYGPGCMWGDVPSAAGDDLCIKAADWLAEVGTYNNALYTDCVADPTMPSTGTAGCLGYNNNVDLWVANGRGTKAEWDAAYTATCPNGATRSSGGGPGGGKNGSPGGKGGRPGDTGGGAGIVSCTDTKTSKCCGDGTCDGPETTENCAADCGGATPSVTGTPAPAPAPAPASASTAKRENTSKRRRKSKSSKRAKKSKRRRKSKSRKRSKRGKRS